MSKKVITLIIILVIICAGIFFSLFERVEVPDVGWNVDYSYENEEPHGAWLLTKILEKAYGEDQVVLLDLDNYIPHHQEDSRKAYFLLSDYVYFKKEKVEDLAKFVEQGNDAIIILSEMGTYMDTLFSTFYSTYSIQDSIVSICNIDENNQYELSYYYQSLDTAVSIPFYILDSLDKNKTIDINVLSYLHDTLPIFIRISYGAGTIYVHSVPDAFSNIGIKQPGMEDYVINTLPLLDIDTIFLDHKRYNTLYGPDQSPLQFIISQPPLKWAYYSGVLGLILFVISRGKRKQRVIPTLKINENTSLEYIQTLSELYKSQYQHDKLAKHLKVIFSQWIKKKYFIKPDDPHYITKISQKSKIPREEIERLISRLNSAMDNHRFDDKQLGNLHRDLNQFYNNCM